MTLGSSPLAGPESRCWKGMAAMLSGKYQEKWEKGSLINRHFKIRSRGTLVLPYSKEPLQSLNVHAHRGSDEYNGPTVSSYLKARKVKLKARSVWKEKQEQKLNRLF